MRQMLVISQTGANYRQTGKTANDPGTYQNEWQKKIVLDP